MTSPSLDPRWEWVEIRTFGDPAPEYARGRCNHLELVDVESAVDGEVLARLCVTCDAQLPPARDHPDTPGAPPSLT